MYRLEVPDYTSPPWLEAAVKPLADVLGVPVLKEFVPIMLATCAGAFLLQQISHFLCPILFPNYYPKLHLKAVDWDLHVVGWAYSIIATPLALALIIDPSPGIVADRLYGYGRAEAKLSAFATGYFIWDTIVSAKNIKTQGLGFFIHGAGCGTAFLFTMKPFLLFCGPNFLIWELSTIFLNMHWYLDKFGKTGSTFQLVNGIFLVGAYVGARLIWGTYQSYFLLTKVLFAPKASAKISNVRYLYAFINVTLNSLNIFWFRAMVNALRKRFKKGDPHAKKEAIEVDGKLSWKREKKAQ